MPRPAQATHPTDDPGLAYRRHDGVLWTVAVCIFLGGAALTALSLILPADDSLTPARVLAASTGVLLTSLGGVLASYLVTRVGAVRDVEASYTRFLSSSARTLATVYNGLQEATAQRRSNAFAHEETYQAAVLMSSNTILAEYDSITALSGRMTDAFQDSKTDLDAVRSVFSSDLITATSRAAERAATPLTAPEPVYLPCPNCGSKNEGSLALRAGWTSTIRCRHCAATFLIHRKSDLTVYVGRVTLADGSDSAAAPVPAPAPAPGSGTAGVAGTQEAVSVQPAVPTPLHVACPTCRTPMRIAQQRPGDTASIKRICIQCASAVTVSPTGAVLGHQSGTFLVQPVTGRRGPHAIVHCDVDEYPLAATYPRKSDGAWVALCTSHLRPFEVSRKDFRAWLESNDPTFLQQRLQHEAAGGAKTISD